MIRKYDFLIIGGGVAGMSYALQIARTQRYRIALCCKTSLEEANTAKAQGGIASVTTLQVDDFEQHIHDTMVAGDWLSDPQAV
ncbi:MAG: FAD-dependent oxidoreductase, partial [Paludibacteraceae bacterium]|nr:FAD-dependent oxidoreductase [Paludibacteraceae bacterium]